MASIPGSQFIATAYNQRVSVLKTSSFSPPPPVPGAFNIEEWTGSIACAPGTPAIGYQGLEVLSADGHRLDLISGSFAVSDIGIWADTLAAHGTDETIEGAGGHTQLDLFGNHDVARGEGRDTIAVYGDFDTVSAYGNNLVDVFGARDLVTGGPGDDTVNAFNNYDTVRAGAGSDTVNVFGQRDVVVAGGGADVVNVFGNSDTVDGGAGPDTISGFGSGDVIVGGSGADSITVYGNNNAINSGSGPDTITAVGSGDTVYAGQQGSHAPALVNLVGGTSTIADGPHTYSDTVVGFSQSAGDRIHLAGGDTVAYALAHSAKVNGGHDTLITLNDGSTILLKGIAHIGADFFS